MNRLRYSRRNCLPGGPCKKERSVHLHRTGGGSVFRLQCWLLRGCAKHDEKSEVSAIAHATLRAGVHTWLVGGRVP